MHGQKVGEGEFFLEAFFSFFIFLKKATAHKTFKTILINARAILSEAFLGT